LARKRVIDRGNCGLLDRAEVSHENPLSYVAALASAGDFRANKQ
jgi:hypothetical protein